MCDQDPKYPYFGLCYTTFMLYIGLLASVIGLWASWKIYRSKRLKTKLVCPLRASCDTVIHSHYSQALGIPNELIGVSYFALIGLLLAAATLGIPHTALYATLLLFATTGALFSLYLVFIQAFTIKAWCSWCMLTALSNIVVWLAVHSMITSGVVDLLAQTKFIWLLMHNIGFILGVGGATITDIFFFKFLKDFRITAEEKGTMDHLSQIIWIGIIVLLMSGYFLYIPQSARLLESSKFLLKLVVVGVIIVNGIFLNMKVAPELASLSFEGVPLKTKQRRIAFALGAVSLTSWYSAFLLGSVRSIPLSLPLGLVVYGGLLFVAIMGSQVFERRLTKRANAASTQNV